MDILLVSAFGEGLWYAAVLERHGHNVTSLLLDEQDLGQLRGLIRPPVHSVSSPADYDLCIFDLTGMGDLADRSREVTPTIGDSTLADKLEHDRVFGLEFMERCGIRVPTWEHFTDADKALSFLAGTSKRYVFKPCGQGAETSSTYVSKSREDMERYLEVLLKRSKVKEFVLQEFVPGTEVSTEMWLSGDSYYAVNHTLEEKKFLAGSLGPATGCAGSVVWMPDRETHLFQWGLKKAVEELVKEGYVGMIDLNAIVTEGNLFGLEWTPRMGYEATQNFTRLLPMEFGDFLFQIAAGNGVTLSSAKHPFCAAIRLSIPPYPFETTKKGIYREGVPIEGIDLKKIESFYLSDARLKEGTEDELETVGTSGLIGAPLGVGDTIAQAFTECVISIGQLKIPDAQWRVDVSDSCQKRYARLESQGWLRPAESGY